MHILVAWLVTLLWLVGAHGLVRLMFLAANWSRFSESPPLSLVGACLYGLRFDLCMITLITIAFLPMALVKFVADRTPPLSRFRDKPISNQIWGAALQSILGLAAAFSLSLDLIDIAYFPMTGRRLTFEIFRIVRTDWRHLLPMTLAYPGIWAAFVTLTAFTWWASGPLARAATSSKWGTTKKDVGGYVLLFLLAIFGIRGGWQLKPLAPTHARIFSNPALGDLALSSSFSVSHTFDMETLPSLSFFGSWETVVSLARPASSPPFASPSSNPQNIVVFIVESLSSEYSMAFSSSDVSYTPFLDTLAKKSLTFPKNQANGRRSIEASFSILFGIPSLVAEPLIQTPYVGSGLTALPNALKKKGYSSAFFHGGAKGTMFFDVMSTLAGFDYHYSGDDFPDQTQTDGTWGILDGPFFSWSIQRMSALPPPFFSTIFTLSSHSPYKIPEKLAGRFPKGTLPIHEAVGYADFALRSFFEEAEKTPWYKDTLFIITGDHTSQSSVENYSELGVYRVPLLMFHPSALVTPQISPHVSQHVDILPTVLDFTKLSHVKSPLFGQSLLNLQGSGRAINHLAGIYWLTEDRQMARLDSQGKSYEFHQLDEGGLKQTQIDADSELRRRLQALIQYFNQGLSENRLYDY